jgi:hypothetical protein
MFQIIIDFIQQVTAETVLLSDFLIAATVMRVEGKCGKGVCVTTGNFGTFKDLTKSAALPECSTLPPT